MTQAERMEFANRLLSEAMDTLIAKGNAYAGKKNDVLANFKRNADRLDLTKYQIWATYFNKHIDSVNNAIAENPEMPVDSAESIHGRVIDIINYAIILECLIKEDEAKK